MSTDFSAYARQLKQLLPPGRLWNTAVGSEISGLLEAVATELARIQDRATALLEEWDPRTTTEMVADWERLLGLPDTCLLELPGTLAERRVAVTQKVANRGGQTPAFYIQLAATMGYAITVTLYAVPRASVARAGDRCYSTEWAYAWLVTLPIAVAYSGAVVGNNVGSMLGSSGQTDIECVIKRAAPAHTAVLFQYTG